MWWVHGLGLCGGAPSLLAAHAGAQRCLPPAAGDALGAPVENKLHFFVRLAYPDGLVEMVVHPRGCVGGTLGVTGHVNGVVGGRRNWVRGPQHQVGVLSAARVGALTPALPLGGTQRAHAHAHARKLLWL